MLPFYPQRWGKGARCSKGSQDCKVCQERLPPATAQDRVYTAKITHASERHGLLDNRYTMLTYHRPSLILRRTATVAVYVRGGWQDQTTGTSTESLKPKRMFYHQRVCHREAPFQVQARPSLSV